jgi:translation initiation factor IF-2
MGHVDHGKTSLLDAIRETNVTAGEAGGITQHIGAYQVEYNNKEITFIDTPGHEAFTAMRARGARVTDIAVLVISAEDGVMPQTVEAINHAKAAGVPIIVAINKMDRPGADAEKVKRHLTEYELVSEEWGGQTICVPVSAKTGQGLDELLEMILLMAEVNDLKTNPDRLARGTIIEAKLDKGRGPVATVLIQNGTLHVGDNIVAGTAAGRVRAMMDYRGRRLKNAGPSTPAEVLGFSDVPLAGDGLYVVAGEKMARQIAAKRIKRKREEDNNASLSRVSLDDLFKQIKEGRVKELNVIIKADVQGSVEALKQSLEGLPTEEVRVNIIHYGVGLISETDILLASASNAIIVGFNVRPDVNARRAAEQEKVDIRLYKVIYEAINDVKAAMSGLLEPEYREVIIGRAEVRKTFKASRIGIIAGCYVIEGKISRDAKVRLIRDDQIVYEGKLDSLKRFKDDVREVLQGYECGLALERFNEIKEGDVVEAVTTETIKRELI